MSFPSHAHLNNCHRVIAKDIHHLICQLAPPRDYIVKDAEQVQRAVFILSLRPAAVKTIFIRFLNRVAALRTKTSCFLMVRPAAGGN
jgi:hypothetical protein